MKLLLARLQIVIFWLVALVPLASFELKKWTESSCQYEKGDWLKCEPNGLQRRLLTLKRNPANSSSQESQQNCHQVKLMQRDCRAVGCKYARGQWSQDCKLGQRVRVDQLVSQLGDTGSCRPFRRVTKDCRRTCHYAKSAWSECKNGIQTRNLTLAADTTPAANLHFQSDANSQPQPQPQSQTKSLAPHCAKFKSIQRRCVAANSTQPTIGTAAAAAASSAPPSAPPLPPPPPTSKLQPIKLNAINQKKRRRLKQMSNNQAAIKLQQQQQQTKQHENK